MFFDEILFNNHPIYNNRDFLMVYVFYYIDRFNNKYLIKRNFFKRFDYHNVLTFNFLRKKLSATLRYKNSIVCYVTPGIYTKKLGIETKKSKKSTKINNVMIKSIVKKCRENENSHKLIIQIKGTKISFYKILEFFNILTYLV